MDDWDGCLVDTMPAHADLAAECIEKHFRMPFAEARENYLATTGVPFDKQLRLIFPDEDQSIVLCSKEYHRRKLTEVYENPANFPETKIFIEAIARICTDFVQVISSNAEESIIKEWASRHNLAQNFFRIYGREHGTKSDHIMLMRQMFPDTKIVFISDSVGDMGLPADYCIGVQAGEKTEEFINSGAEAALSGPINAECIVEIILEAVTKI